jgi:hypothetical protein
MKLSQTFTAAQINKVAQQPLRDLLAIMSGSATSDSIEQWSAKKKQSQTTAFDMSLELAEYLYDQLRGLGDVHQAMRDALRDEECPPNAAVWKLVKQMLSARTKLLDILNPLVAENSVERASLILGLRWPCTADEVEKAYRAQAQAKHPDHGGDHDEFVELQRAYEMMKERLMPTSSAA